MTGSMAAAELKQLPLEGLAWLEPALLLGKAPRAAPGQWHEPWVARAAGRLRQKKGRGACKRAEGSASQLRSMLLERSELKPHKPE